MRRKAIIAGGAVVAIVVGLVLATTLVVAPSPFPPISARYINSVQSGKWVKATFEITNRTPSSYYFVRVDAVETHIGSDWSKCLQFSSYPGVGVLPRSYVSKMIAVTGRANAGLDQPFKKPHF